ncbi:MAG: hypothetical protein M0C28_14185 [Candidatus Moduliflexus flocculans]|nr:hypothetical protein [Candidatus Moduliflexus flocculans]
MTAMRANGLEPSAITAAAYDGPSRPRRPARPGRPRDGQAPGRGHPQLDLLSPSGRTIRARGIAARTGTEIAAKFPGTKPEAIWIVGPAEGPRHRDVVPGPARGRSALITGMPEDISEPVLRLFDGLGYRVWLQTEAGLGAFVDQAFHVMLDRYGHHTCVIGSRGRRSSDTAPAIPTSADPVTDEMARSRCCRFRL